MGRALLRTGKYYFEQKKHKECKLFSSAQKIFSPAEPTKWLDFQLSHIEVPAAAITHKAPSSASCSELDCCCCLNATTLGAKRLALIQTAAAASEVQELESQWSKVMSSLVRSCFVLHACAPLLARIAWPRLQRQQQQQHLPAWRNI